MDVLRPHPNNLCSFLLFVHIFMQQPKLFIIIRNFYFYTRHCLSMNNKPSEVSEFDILQWTSNTSAHHELIQYLTLVTRCFSSSFFSILGMNIFGCKFCTESEGKPKSCDRKNFDSLLWASITVFQVHLVLCFFGFVGRHLGRLTTKCSTL